YSKKESHQKASEIALKKIDDDNDFQDKLLSAVTKDENQAKPVDIN
ncbi:MAG: ribonuclease III, partial [Bacteroidales bacterium]|nr:ribonuclease III [Bacteroidales bacterium]